ncbi:MAG: hypothetical protein ACXAEU_11590 [Candidatus Hodarchaeales archaeon]|jgi:hypothetical protein
MRRKLFVWACLAIFMVSFVQPGKSSVAAMEPWGNFYSPVIDETVAGVVDVLFYMNGNSTDIFGILYLEHNINGTWFSLYNTTGAGNHSFAWDTTSWENGNYELKLIIYDDFYVTNTTIYSGTFSVLNNPRISYTGNFRDRVVDAAGLLGLQIEFEFEILQPSTYRVQLDVRDQIGFIWYGDDGPGMYLSTGYHWFNIPFWADYLSGSGFGGGSFYLQNLRIYDVDDSDNLIWNGTELGETRNYDPSAFDESKMYYTGTRYDNVDFTGDTSILFEFEFYIYQPSNYRAELEIRDYRGTVWNETWYGGYLPSGYKWLQFDFLSTYLFDLGFNGSSFDFQRLTVFDVDNSSNIIWESWNFGSTNYYPPDAFDSSVDMLSYTDNSRDKVVFTGETSLLIEFEFEIYHSSDYSAYLEIRDDRGEVYDASWGEYLYTGYNWIYFDFWAYKFFDLGFNGSSFAFQRLTIYDNYDGGKIVWEMMDFGSTSYYYPWDFEGGEKLQYNENWSDWVDDWGDQKALVIEFDFDVYYTSSYNYELEIVDHRGTTWKYSLQRYLYEGQYWLRCEFSASYLFDQGFDGSTFHFRRLSIYDLNDGSSLTWERWDFGSTRYYERSELEGGGSDLHEFGVHVDDVITIEIDEFDGNFAAEQFLTAFFVQDYNNGPLVHVGDTIEYRIDEVLDTGVNAQLFIGDQSWGVQLFPTMGLPVLIPLDLLGDLHKLAPSDSNSEVNEYGDSVELKYDLNGSSVAFAYYKDSGVLKSLFLENYFMDMEGFDYVEIYHCTIHGYHEPSGNGGNSSSEFTFSTPGFELLLVFIAIPVLPYLRKKSD